MAFDSLASKLQGVFKKLRGKGKLSEQDIKLAMREVKLALLESDVNYKVVKTFISRVSEKSLGKEVLESLTPAQQVIKIVNDELKSIMGNDQSKLNYNSNSTTVIMLVGLQGAGKTTMAAKLSLYCRKSGKSPLMIACDVYRPAAVKQLEVLGNQIDIPVFSIPDSKDPLNIVRKGLEKAESNMNNVVIIDTAGRLHIDDNLMDELREIKEISNPSEILMVIDSMIGQESVNIAETFNEKLDVTGFVLTKLDGDTRGGVALSIKEVIGKNIKFIGVGEKISDLEVFHPDRMASRILGMGDVLSLIEKAQESIDQEEAQKLSERMFANEFNFEDFKSAMHQMKKLGSFSKILQMIPGIGNAMKELKNINLDDSEKELSKIEAIINSMTAKERKNPKLLIGSASRKSRIAKGSGSTTAQVNKLIKDFENMSKMMKQFKGMTGKGKFGKKGFFPKLPF
ncbi:signal recognition particle protein [Candidatus Arthromitus sp. SFB-rat-Yit]|uniref:signal recognition particle protein n=1 Tax=Candidatus Arthromitus sp. SFB-rat-Yit TaxID=1041504 RepID=UPI000227A6E7|nr:signal recognition particle protein [Candidatus Arthromitus sp. SFB-rat-Yit]BAK81126.1 signal recognition particle protein [Candidatus Arthromitus sp. SFB-rat-Yit]